MHHMTLLHTKYIIIQALSLVVSEKKIFFHMFPIISLRQIMASLREWPILTPEAWLSGFIKRIT